MIYDALIVGGGPAGLSAALALGRANRTALLFDSGAYRNAGVKAMHTVLSRDGANPDEFRSIARSQIERYTTISLRKGYITHAANEEIEPGYKGFKLTDGDGTVFNGRKLVLATGSQDILPDNIEGYKENWPQHIYQCLLCDGFDEKDYPIGVLAFDTPAYGHLSVMALKFNPSVTIYSNGGVPDAAPVQQALQTALACGAKLDDRKIRRLVNNGEGPARGVTIEFETGPSATLGMLLHKPPTRNHGQHLIEQLGLKTGPSGDVAVDPMFTESSVKGCIVAGDTSEVVKQASLAMGSGTRAGAVVSLQLCNEEGAKALAAAKAGSS
ncbi:hypothetical protein B0J12DRAFT_601353 [Macrophomina phaseolina]|uniref:FAD/NAD(P)-binding domain-containing protein n=1 Tax=Macrophomina phaseolina TaxID=35725 RepID=A0ABQ8G8D3_9PEZI|nr:hypothetical protein B0J12DRAFT_601353 [Macrophomina phaseolina]